MFASPRRISVSLSSRPWLYWCVVAAAAVATGLAAQHISSPALATSCASMPAAAVATAAVTRGIAVPLGDPALPVRVGDQVDVVGVAKAVKVLAVTDTAAVIGVELKDVDAVVAAVRARSTTLTLVQRAAEMASTAKPAATR
jgi:hypothetical protein